MREEKEKRINAGLAQLQANVSKVLNTRNIQLCSVKLSLTERKIDLLHEVSSK